MFVYLVIRIGSILPDGGEIVFSTYDGLINNRATNDLYVMDVDQTLAFPIAKQQGNSNIEPRWSPDGMQIAFVARNNKRHYLYVIDPLGRNARLLAPDFDISLAPVWSPDGKRIAFVTSISRKIYIAMTDLLTGQTYVMSEVNSADPQPTWSPDGDYLFYVTSKNERAWLQEVRTDCATQLNGCQNNAVDVLSDIAVSSSPVWSQGGREIVFDWINDDHVEFVSGIVNCFDLHQDYCLESLKTIASNQNRIDSYAAWSPNSQYLAFIDVTSHIQVMNRASGIIDSKAPIPSILYMHGLTWSPDSKHLTFEAESTDRQDIYVMNVVDNTTYRLTSKSNHNSDPSWRPLPH